MSAVQTRNRNQEVAMVILQQLGGRGRLSVLTGAKDFMAIENGVQFSIGRNAAGVNRVRIVLTADDLYNVEFGAVRRVRGAFRPTRFWTALKVLTPTCSRNCLSAQPECT